VVFIVFVVFWVFWRYFWNFRGVWGWYNTHFGVFFGFGRFSFGVIVCFAMGWFSMCGGFRVWSFGGIRGVFIVFCCYFGVFLVF